MGFNGCELASNDGEIALVLGGRLLLIGLNRWHIQPPGRQFRCRECERRFGEFP